MSSPNAFGWIRPYERELEQLLRFSDLGIIAGSLWLSNVIHDAAWGSAHTVAVSAAAVFYLLSDGTGLHARERGQAPSANFKGVLLSWTIVVALLLLAAFATRTSEVHSRIVITTWFGLAPALLCAWRLLLSILAVEARARGYNSRRAAIAGVTELGLEVARRIQAAPWVGLSIVGFFDDRLNSRGNLATIPHKSFDDLVVAARRGEIDIVYMALPPRAEPRTAHLIRELADTTASVHLAFDFGGFDLLRAHWSSVAGIPTMAIVDGPFEGTDGALKRLQDIVIGSAILAACALPMVLIALAVKLSSPGPVFFRQRRYGLGGDEIMVLKFRSMTVCEDGTKVTQATRDDARVTRLGAFLRRTSLDELPQFFNVLTGSMSIVGPRPHAVAHNEEYRALIQGYMLRHKVKPGITGWAQVNGWRGETEDIAKMRARVEHDLDYIRNWRLSLDLQIMVRTALMVVRGTNAY